MKTIRTFAILLMFVPLGWTLAGPRYNEVRQKSAHNSFQKMESVLDQMVYHRIRSLEFDFHNSKATRSSLKGDWYVYHINVVDANTSCDRLSDCLKLLRAFHDATPGHEPVTVWLDIKTDWRSGQNPAELDALLNARIGRDNIYAPRELSDGCAGQSQLRSVVRDAACGWPLLEDLRGKFLFVLTGSDSRLYAYSGSDATADSRSAFIAPGLSSAAQVGVRSYVVFYNMSDSNRHLGDDVQSAHFVGRAYYINDSGKWSDAVRYRVNHIATDKVNYHQDSWARTHNALGWPFECFLEDCGKRAPTDNVITLNAKSDDIWGSSDSFGFLYDKDQSNGTWTALASSVSSHTEDWSKGCVMARASLSAKSAYLAICKPGDDHKLRVQYRKSFGSSTSRTDIDLGRAATDEGITLDDESRLFLKLRVSDSGKCATGYGSYGGDTWVAIKSFCFSDRLAYQGLAASSHNTGKWIKFHFSGVTKNGAAKADVVNFYHLTPVGSGSDVRALDSF